MACKLIDLFTRTADSICPVIHAMQDISKAKQEFHGVQTRWPFHCWNSDYVKIAIAVPTLGLFLGIFIFKLRKKIKAQREKIKTLEDRCNSQEEECRGKDGKLEELRQQVHILTTKLASEMSNKISSDESSVENVSIRNRPMNVAEEYQLACSNEWLAAKEVFDKYAEDEDFEESQLIEMLCLVIEISSEAARDLYKDFNESLEHLMRDPVIHTKQGLLEDPDEPFNNLKDKKQATVKETEDDVANEESDPPNGGSSKMRKPPLGSDFTDSSFQKLGSECADRAAARGFGRAEGENDEKEEEHEVDKDNSAGEERSNVKDEHAEQNGVPSLDSDSGSFKSVGSHNYNENRVHKNRKEEEHEEDKDNSAGEERSNVKDEHAEQNGVPSLDSDSGSFKSVGSHNENENRVHKNRASQESTEDLAEGLQPPGNELDESGQNSSYEMVNGEASHNDSNGKDAQESTPQTDKTLEQKLKKTEPKDNVAADSKESCKMEDNENDESDGKSEVQPQSIAGHLRIKHRRGGPRFSKELSNSVGDYLRNDADHVNLEPVEEAISCKIESKLTSNLKTKQTKLWDSCSSAPEVKDYVSTMSRIAWKMALQRPQMRFDMSKKWIGEANQDIYWSSVRESDCKDIIVVYPMLYHDTQLMAKGKIYRVP